MNKVILDSSLILRTYFCGTSQFSGVVHASSWTKTWFLKKSPKGLAPGGTPNLSPENINKFFELFRLIAFQNTQTFCQRLSLPKVTAAQSWRQNRKYPKWPCGPPIQNSCTRGSSRKLLEIGEIYQILRPMFWLTGQKMSQFFREQFFDLGTHFWCSANKYNFQRSEIRIFRVFVFFMIFWMDFHRGGGKKQLNTI